MRPEQWCNMLGELIWLGQVCVAAVEGHHAILRHAVVHQTVRQKGQHEGADSQR